MKEHILAAAFAAGVACAFGALAQDSGPSAEQAERIAETRQGLLKVVGWNMAPIGAVARGRAPYDADVAAKNAERLAQLGAMIPDAFAVDTSGFDLETEALAGIWSDKEDFDAKAAALVEAALALQAAATNEGESATVAAMRSLAQTCGDCHDSYRKD